MKILIFSDFAGNLGDAIRIRKIYDYLRKNHDVVLCNVRYFYKPRLKLLQHPTVAASAVQGFMRDKHIAPYRIYEKLAKEILIQQIKKVKPDIILAEGVVLGTAAIQIPENSARVIVDIHGLASFEYQENPYTETNARKLRLLQDMEQQVIEKSWKVLVVSKNMARYMNQYLGAKRGKMIIVRNGSDVQEKIAMYKTPLNVIFGGIFAFWENIDTYMDMVYYDTTKSCFNLLGRGPLKKGILGCIKKRKLPVRYLGYMSREESLRVFSGMNVGVAPTSNNVTRSIALPIKVFDYMACGLPVITQKYGEWGQIVKKEGCGIVTKRSDGKEFAEALKQMTEKKIWQEMANNSVRAIQTKYNWESVLAPLNQAVE